MRRSSGALGPRSSHISAIWGSHLTRQVVSAGGWNAGCSNEGGEPAGWPNQTRTGILRAADRCESNPMTQLTPLGLIKILGQVTGIMVIPIVGAAVAGLVADRILGTSPLLVLSALLVGTLVAALGIWLLIRAGMRKGYGGRPGHGA
jgi:hypothetical protein